MDMLKKNRFLVLGGALLVSALLIGATALTVGAQANRNSSRDSSGCGGNGGGYSGMMGMGMMGMSSMMRDIDKHFIEQMIPHHQGAIAMADLALQKAQRPEIKALAADIKRTQTAEIEQMRAWYKEWYGVDVPTSTNDFAGGMMSSGGMMGGGMMGGGMMGGGMMGGGMDMGGNTQDLVNATDFDKAFIEQMIPHHQMAVMMAGMALAGGEKAELRTLAQSISTSQSAEIEKMRAWYKSWYGTSAP